MNEKVWSTVDDYFSDALVGSDPVLDMVVRSSAEHGLPAIHVAPTQGKLLNLLVRLHGSQRILEIGTLAGYSAIWLARALGSGGSLVSLEGNSLHARLSRQNIESAGLSGIVEVMVGAAIDSLDRLIEQGTEPFDFVFIDADKENNDIYLGRVLQLLKPGAVIIADNVVRKGGVADRANHDADVEGVRRFIKLLADDERLDSTAIQTVGVKGWDGFSISIYQPQQSDD
ncbi:O-methyltransferase [Allopusillimonas ginsengisoli]|nr:O-methyltransferase [Allopusillimonas ginsengisoli]